MSRIDKQSLLDKLKSDQDDIRRVDNLQDILQVDPKVVFHNAPPPARDIAGPFNPF